MFAQLSRHSPAQLLLGAVVLLGLGTSPPAGANSLPVPGTPQAASSATQASLAESATLRKIQDTGVLVLGHRVASAPFSYLNAQLKPIGYSVDICQHIIEAVQQRLGLQELEIKRVAVTSATRMPLVANGSIDLECGITTNTLERQKTQAFSLTTFVAETRLLSKRASAVRSLADLRGKPVASTIATTSIQFLHQANVSEGLDLKILVGQDDRDAFRLLETDRAVAYAMDDVLLRMALLGSSRPGDYLVSDEAFSLEPYAIGLPAADPVFKALVDSVIGGLYRSGEIQTIYRKWFQSPIPPKGQNLQLPMSDSFKRVIAKPSDSADPQHYR
ncbi:amino acid ABC transporter substrate-binding protein [Paucibacter sp. Y2R2-4]|uniref:amino acid ABC transporter substrate-binding protein n=1 Tax=Paucibacter sp. Y2R2-4 TaxID=2893553 RepID=UPI0021E4805B|nr:amino acid ABC transporter substrate-binding protein [Paucibacter sp. Y2R2-4]MCV2348462.1 amino acid ABC transporter substrate-binding protein [Paucibacter sp. Y2R2-4]